MSQIAALSIVSKKPAVLKKTDLKKDAIIETIPRAEVPEEGEQVV